MSRGNAWLDNFVTYAGANLANLGLVQADIDSIVTAQQGARSATAQMNADRAAASRDQDAGVEWG